MLLRNPRKYLVGNPSNSAYMLSQILPPLQHGFKFSRISVVVYFQVVFVVFATIVLLLLATNCRSSPPAAAPLTAEEPQPQPTIVHLKNSGVCVRTETFAEENIV